MKPPETVMSRVIEMPELIRRMLEKNDAEEIDPTYLRGALMRGMDFAQLLYRAFARTEPPVWTNVFTPPELIFGCGCIPFWLDGAGGFSGWIEIEEVFDKADTVLPSPDICTFLRAAVGGAFTGLFPKPRMVICSSHLCEGALKIARIAATHFEVDFHPLDVPPTLSEEAVRYVADQLQHLAQRLCRLSNSKLDLDRLREAIDLSNQARRHFLDVAKMRKHVPAPTTGSQFIGMGLVYPWGTSSGVTIAETLRDEILGRVTDNVPAVQDGERHRLMWIHLRPVFETDIMAYVEQRLRAVIVVDVLGEVWWPELDAREPFRALATKMLSNPELLPMERKVERLLRLADGYHVDGVVHFLQWGCRWNMGQSSIFKAAMTGAGLPFLALDGDAVDKRATPHGQMLTRLEAFMELLESAGSCKERAR